MTRRTTLFRPEVVTYRSLDQGFGGPLRLSPAPLVFAYRALVIASVAVALFVVLARMPEFASGPAIVRFDGRADVTAKSEAVVAEVLVAPGQRVAEGAVLARYHDAVERADLEKANQDFELQLQELLRAPGEESRRAKLAALRTARDLAAARLDERVQRAPFAGIVSDVRIRVGQHLAPGDTVASVVREGSTPSIVVFLPGHHRPRLRAGMSLRIQMSGYPYVYAQATIRSVADEIVGPSEVARYLGRDRADALPVQGPVVIVRASLPAESFVFEGETYRYFDGLQGTADVRVRSTPFAFTLFPSLRALFGDDDGRR